MSTVKNRPGPKLAQAKIVRRDDLTPDLMRLWIEKPPGFSFKAGQYCTIGLEGIERAYSILSAPYEKDLELFIELVPLPDGVLTPRLWNLKVGDSVSIRPRAKGLFIFKPDLPNQLMVGTVTGVVPYISIIRDYLNSGKHEHHFYVLAGASYIDELAYNGELEQLSGETPDILPFVSTVSRPAEERNKVWTGETGRVNLIVERYIDKLGLTPENTLVYACGHPSMIEDVKSRLVPQGFRVEEERFWKED